MSKAEETRIQDVLAKPFGPYLDSLILEKKCTTTGKESAVLHSVMMECGGQVIGLDFLAYCSRTITENTPDLTKPSSRVQTPRHVSINIPSASAVYWRSSTLTGSHRLVRSTCNKTSGSGISISTCSLIPLTQPAILLWNVSIVEIL